MRRLKYLRPPSLISLLDGKIIWPIRYEIPRYLVFPNTQTNILRPFKSPFVMGAVATTLLTISFGMLNFRDVTLQAPVFVADLCFAAGAGLIISAQWEMLKGNTFSYTVLMAFGTNARRFWQECRSGNY